MPAKFLSPMERLTFQAGSVVQVKVTDIDGENVIVAPRSSKYSESKTKSGPKYNFAEWDPSLSNPFRSSGSKDFKQVSSINKRANSIQAQQQAPGPMLATMKTGMSFLGTVISVTQYAAFVDINVFRKSKGGTFTRVSGMLHYSDLADKAIFATNRKAMRTRLPVLDKGTRVKVYVKEVLKNAG